MPQSRHRDRGFSRRISNGLFFGYVAAAVGIVVAFGLLLVARFDPVAFQGIRGLALDLTAPFSGLTRGIVRGADDVGTHFGDYFDAAAKNDDYRLELAANRRALIEARITLRENERLKRLLHLVEQGARPVVTARIVGSTLSGQRRYATLAAGHSDGVIAGQPVRGPEGLIGRVAEAGHGWSRVELLTDGGSSVPVRMLRTGQPALVIGHGEGSLDVRSTQSGAPNGLMAFRRGDLLVTSGTGGVFPPDIPVAVVVSVNGEVGTALPLAAPGRLDFAIVLPEVASAPPPAVGAR